MIEGRPRWEVEARRRQRREAVLGIAIMVALFAFAGAASWWLLALASEWSM